MQTQKHSKDFSQIYKTVLHDKTLSAFDRGLLITLYNLPDDWKFSVSGLCSILPDGKSAISGSLRRLEDKGYLRLTKARNEKGLFETSLELCIPSETSDTKPCTIIGDGHTVTDDPSPSIRPRLSATDMQPQYKTHRKTDIKKHNNPSFFHYRQPMERKTERPPRKKNKLRIENLSPKTSVSIGYWMLPNEAKIRMK